MFCTPTHGPLLGTRAPRRHWARTSVRPSTEGAAAPAAGSSWTSPSCISAHTSWFPISQDGLPITFAEWGYLGKCRFQRRDFRLATLTQSSAFSAEGSLFADLGKHEIFQPVETYPPMTVSELAAEFVLEVVAPMQEEKLWRL